METNKNLIEKARKVKSVEELIALAKENGVELPLEEANKIFCEIKEYGEIKDDDLDKVSGGGCYSPEGYLKTTIGYGCDLYERVDGAISGVEGTCYMCKYWNRAGSFMPTIIMGQALKCMHPGNKR